MAGQKRYGSSISMVSSSYRTSSRYSGTSGTGSTPEKKPSPSSCSSVRDPVASTVTERAYGRSARTSTPPGIGCAPSTSCGAWWSPASSRPRSAVSRAGAGRAPCPSAACRGRGGTASARVVRARLAGAGLVAVSAGAAAGAAGVAADGSAGASTGSSTGISALLRDALRDGLRAVTGTASSEGEGESGGGEGERGWRGRIGEEGGAAQAAADRASRWMAAIGTGSQSGRCRASYSTSYTALSVSWARSSSGSPRGSEPDAWA